METTSSAGGAAGVAGVLTAVLPSTLEDLMALALCGALSYVSFLNWPLKRADIKAAIAEKYDELAGKLDAELSEELRQGTGKLRARTEKLIAPLLDEAQGIQATVEARQARLEVRLRLRCGWVAFLLRCCAQKARATRACSTLHAHPARGCFRGSECDSVRAGVDE